MKKLWMLGLVMMLLMVPTVAFADEIPEDWESIRLEQVAEYTPESYDEWVRLFEAKEVLSEERETLKETLDQVVEDIWEPYMEDLKEEAKVLMEAYREVLKEQVAEETITLEEAKVLFEAYKLEVYADLILMKEDRDTEKSERQADHAYFEGLRQERKAYNAEIRMAIEAGDEAMISYYLNSILEINQILESHAIEVNAEIQEKIDELNNL